MDTKEELVTVIRIVQYKGSADAVRSALAKSLPLGVKEVVGYTLTVAEHSSNLPPAIELDESEVNDALAIPHCQIYDPCDDCREAEGSGYVDRTFGSGESSICEACGQHECNGECMEIP